MCAKRWASTMTSGDASLDLTHPSTAARPLARVYGEPMNEMPRDLYIPPEALEIFLDRVALHAAPTTSHLLDPRYREFLGGQQERAVAAELNALVERLDRLDADVEPGWGLLAEALRAIGASNTEG